MNMVKLCLLLGLTALIGSHTAAAGQLSLFSDFRQLQGLLPTMYYIAHEDKTPCTGVYRGITYNGSEQSQVLTPKGEVLANVCTRYLKVLMMEGTGILSDRGQGELTVNWAGNGRFLPVGKCVHGLGVRGKCLLPYHTIAADLEVYQVNSVIYIPRTKGLVLPDGMIHNGYFVVRDTGGAFRGIGARRVDLFTNMESDQDNIFSRAGFHHRKSEDAYLVVGETKKQVLAEFAERFGDLF